MLENGALTFCQVDEPTGVTPMKKSLPIPKFEEFSGTPVRQPSAFQPTTPRTPARSRTPPLFTAKTPTLPIALPLPAIAPEVEEAPNKPITKKQTNTTTATKASKIPKPLSLSQKSASQSQLVGPTNGLKTSTNKENVSNGR
jgi:hypothetical protein